MATASQLNKNMRDSDNALIGIAVMLSIFVLTGLDRGAATIAMLYLAIYAYNLVVRLRLDKAIAKENI